MNCERVEGSLDPSFSNLRGIKKAESVKKKKKKKKKKALERSPELKFQIYSKNLRFTIK